MEPIRPVVLEYPAPTRGHEVQGRGRVRRGAGVVPRTAVLAGVMAAVALAGCASAGAGGGRTGAVAAAAFGDAVVAQAALAPGVTLVTVEDRRGPWTSYVVEVDTGVCRPVFEVRKPDGPLSGRATTSALAYDAVAVVNADFFRLPGGTPVGAHVARGVPLIGPTTWPVLAFAADGAVTYGTASLHGTVRAGADSVAVVQLNRAADTFLAYPQRTRGGATLFTARADSVPADSAAWRVLMRRIDGDEGAGRAVVLAADSPATATALRAGDVMVHGVDEASAWARRRVAGDTVHWRVRLSVPRGGGAGDMVPVEAVGGFPALLRAARPVLDEQVVNPGFGQGRHPRTAVGWTADGSRAWLVVVDGRQPPYSDGMSLDELTWLFQRLGADHALNLDGGGSTAMVVGGRLVNRPSDAEGERAVGNALALARCGR